MHTRKQSLLISQAKFDICLRRLAKIDYEKVKNTIECISLFFTMAHSFKKDKLHCRFYLSAVHMG